MGIKVDIFVGLRKCSDEEQATLAALLEQGHLGSAVGPEMGKAFNKVISFLKKEAEPPHVSFEMRLEQAKQRFLVVSSDERINFIRVNIADRVSYSKDKSGPTISIAALRAVAKKHGADSYLLPCALASRVMTSKLKQMSEEFRKRWEEARPEQRAQFDRELEKQLASLTPEKQSEMRQAFNVETLDAQTMRGIMFSLGSTVGLSSVVNMAGFGAYIALSVIVHFIFTTILGITLPFAVYAFLSSTLAFFANPVVAIPLGVGTTTYQWITQGRKMNIELIDIVVFTGLANDISVLSSFSQLPRWCSTNADKTGFVSTSRQIQSLKQTIEQKNEEVQTALVNRQSATAEVMDLRTALVSTKANAEAAQAKWASLSRELVNFDSQNQAGAKTPEEQADISAQRANIEAQITAARSEQVTAEQKSRIAEQKARTIPDAEVRAAKALTIAQSLETELTRLQQMLDEIYAERSGKIADYIEPRTPYLTYNERVFASLARLDDLEAIQQAEAVLLELNEGFYQQVGGPDADAFSEYDYAWFGTGHRLYFPKNRGLHITYLGHHTTAEKEYKQLAMVAPDVLL